MLAHGPKLEARDRLCRMARQNLAGRRDVERPAPPSAQASFRVACEIVRHYGVNNDDAAVAFPQSFHTIDRMFDLLSRWHQLRAVRKSPAVILNLGNFDPAGAKRDRLVNHVGDAVDIGMMNDSIDGERNAKAHHCGGESAWRLKSDRVRTVGTAERTAMGDLGQKPKWMH